jgi:hypothetical protein
MQRKQQVGEFWVCVIFFACVCVGMSDMKNASDDIFVVCTGLFPRGVLGGVGMPPLVIRSIWGSPPNFFLGGFCYF